MKKLILIMFFCLFPIFVLAETVTLSWDPNSETDLAGYKIYYGYSSGIYDGAGIDQGNSPIILQTEYPDDPNYIDNTGERVEIPLTGLDLINYDYYIVVTAYNNEYESSYSNEVNTLDDSPTSGGGGSSGSSGCFVLTISKIRRLK